MDRNRFERIRRSRVFRFILGGSALSLAVGGTAAAANAVLSHEDETESVSLDLEDGQVDVAVGDDEAADALDDADAGIEDESPSPATPPTPPTPDTPDSPDSPTTPPTPDSPDSPDSPDQESPDSPEGEDDDDQGEDSPEDEDD